MPYLKIRKIKSNDAKTLPEEFRDFIQYIYGGKCLIESDDGAEAQIYMDVPGKMKRAEFDADVGEWCQEHGCSYDLIDQAPEAPSRQYFSENVKLMYPRAKDYETLKKNPNRFNIAKRLWKESWPMEFDESLEEDREDILALYNEYMEELSEWKPVMLKLKYGKK